MVKSRWQMRSAMNLDMLHGCHALYIAVAISNSNCGIEGFLKTTQRVCCKTYFSEGLVDTASEDDFGTKLNLLEKCWCSIESTNSDVIPGFYRWFVQNKAEIMKTTMLKPVREEAGLGCPPEQFTTNSSEAVNSVIKSHVDHKSHQLVNFVSRFKELVDEQEREIERAVIGRGKYRFMKDYSDLQISESRWFNDRKTEWPT